MALPKTLQNHETDNHSYMDERCGMSKGMQLVMALVVVPVLVGAGIVTMQDWPMWAWIVLAFAIGLNIGYSVAHTQEVKR